VLVSAMGASILSRNRNILVRAAFPVAVGVGAAKYFLPHTSQNIGNLVWRWEQKFPVLADTHTRTQARVERVYTTSIEHSKMSAEMLSHKIGEVRENVEGWVRKGR